MGSVNDKNSTSENSSESPNRQKRLATEDLGNKQIKRLKPSTDIENEDVPPTPEEKVFALQEMTDLIVKFALRNTHRNVAFKLRLVSSRFENAVRNMASPEHCIRLDLGLDNDRSFLENVAKIMPKGSKPSGVPIVLRICSGVISPLSYDAIHRISPNIIKVIVLQQRKFYSFKINPWTKLTFPRLRYVKAFAPENQLYFSPEECLHSFLCLLLNADRKHTLEFELKYEVTKGQIVNGGSTLPSQVTKITGFFADFPFKVFESAANLKQLQGFQIICDGPRKTSDARRIITHFMDKTRNSLKSFIIRCGSTETLIEANCFGTFSLEVLTLPSFQLILENGVNSFSISFPRLQSLTIGDLLEKKRQQGSLTCQTRGHPIKHFTIGEYVDMNLPTSMLQQFVSLKYINLTFSKLSHVYIALENIFCKCYNLEEAVINFAPNRPKPIPVDLTHLLTSVASADTFLGQSHWSRLRLCETVSIASLKALKSLTLSFVGIQCEVTAFLMDTLCNLEDLKHLGIGKSIKISQSLRKLWKSTGRQLARAN